MKVSLRSVTMLYTVGLAFGVSAAVGVAMYAISSRSLERAYERQFEATAHEAAYQMVDPVYRLDAFGVQRLSDLLAETRPALSRSLVLDVEGRPFGGWSTWRREELDGELEAALTAGRWSITKSPGEWRFVGPVMDASARIHGAVAFEYSAGELRQDLNQTAAAAVVTALSVTLLGCVVGFALARRATRPFSRLVGSVREIGEQQFSAPVEVASPLAEIDDLAHALSRMASQLEKTTVSLEEAESARREAERANDLKSRFLQNLSHEVRTPLHAIVGHSDLLRAAGLTEGQAERVEGIRTAAGALLRLIEDILDLSRIESGNLELAHEAFDLEQTVREVVELTHVGAVPGTLDLFGLVAPDVAPLRWGDPDRLQQVLANLVSNALKFSSRGTVLLEVEAVASDRVRFVVSDTGPGIPDSELPTVLQPFARLIESAAIPGSGLGLTICSQLAAAMGAELRLESLSGEGTKAIFEVPMQPVRGVDPRSERSRRVRLFGFPAQVERGLRRWLGEVDDGGNAGKELALVYLEGCAEPASVAATVEDVEDVLVFSPTGGELAGVAQARTLRMPVTTGAIERALDATAATTPAVEAPARLLGLEVLVVEDSLINRYVLVAMLESLGCRVTTGIDGQEGLEAWRKLRPAVVLMDCSMPVLDGLEATRRIRLEEAESQDRVPILALTANASPEDRRRCREAGMDGFLSKPLALEELQQALEKTIAGGCLDDRTTARSTAEG